jgi:hypothetical protein
MEIDRSIRHWVNIDGVSSRELSGINIIFVMWRRGGNGKHNIYKNELNVNRLIYLFLNCLDSGIGLVCNGRAPMASLSGCAHRYIYFLLGISLTPLCQSSLYKYYYLKNFAPALPAKKKEERRRRISL